MQLEAFAGATYTQASRFTGCSGGGEHGWCADPARQSRIERPFAAGLSETVEQFDAPALPLRMRLSSSTVLAIELTAQTHAAEGDQPCYLQLHAADRLSHAPA